MQGQRENSIPTAAYIFLAYHTLRIIDIHGFYHGPGISNRIRRRKAPRVHCRDIANLYRLQCSAVRKAATEAFCILCKGIFLYAFDCLKSAISSVLHIHNTFTLRSIGGPKSNQL